MIAGQLLTECLLPWCLDMAVLSNGRGETPFESDSQFLDKMKTPVEFVSLCTYVSPTTYPIKNSK